MIVTTEQAVSLLKRGEIVALPTETLYGLAALPEEYEKLYQFKGRPREKRFAVAISSIEMMERFQPEIPESFHQLAEEHWPGPLTLVLPTNEGTTAFRMPDHPKTLEVIAETGPLILTSANRSGEPSCISIEEVDAAFDETLPVIDGGRCRLSEASTILAYTEGNWITLREGSLKPELPTNS